MGKNKRTQRLYTTSEVCDMYGLSASGLRFFEEKGLITPERDSGNRYRVFTLTECSRLFFCRILRQYGFNINQCVQLLLSGTPEDYTQNILERKIELEAEIAEKQALLASLNRAEAIFRQLKRRTPYHIVTSPTMLRVSWKDSDSPRSISDIFQKWYNALPFSAASLLIDQNSLADKQHDPLVTLGFIIESIEASKYGLHPDGHTTLLPARRCLYTILHCNDTLDNIAESLQPALNTIADMGFSLDGHPFTRMLCSADLGHGMERFDEAWFPIAPVKK